MSRDPSLLEAFERTVAVRLEGRSVALPENNSLLRLLQYLGFDLYPCRLCWNGDCDNCRFVFRDPATGLEISEKGCLFVVFDGMEVTRLPEGAGWPEDLPDP